MDGLFNGAEVVDAVVEYDRQSCFPFVEVEFRRSLTLVAE
jgi:hypothetical protein